MLTGKPTGKRPLGRPRRRWENNIRMDLEEIGINAGNWVDSAHERNYCRGLVNAALNLRVPKAMELFQLNHIGLTASVKKCYCGVGLFITYKSERNQR